MRISGLGTVGVRCCNLDVYLFLSPLCYVSILVSGFSNAYLGQEDPLAYTFNSMYFHKTELSTITAAWLLPIVAPIVAAASGGIVAEVLPNPHHALWTNIVSYILSGTSVPLAMAVLVIFSSSYCAQAATMRSYCLCPLIVGASWPRRMIMMQSGKVALQTFPKTHTLQAVGPGAGVILYVAAWLMALIMWDFRIVWLFFALASISRSKFPFNMGGWGFAFPLGVFAISTTTLGKETPSTLFSVLGTMRTRSVSLPIIKAIYGSDLGKKAQAAKHFGESTAKIV